MSTLPPWPSMRGNQQNTGARVFGWDGVPRAIRFLDTGQLAQALSLINATPIVGADETIYAGSSNNHFFVFPLTGASLARQVGNIVDSAGCFVNASTLYFPCGDYSLYSMSTPNGAPQPHSLEGTVDSVSTINWFEGNVVTDPSGHLFAGCDNFYLFSCDPSDPGTFFRWGFPTGFFIWSACAFSIDGTTAYFVSADMTCYALDLTATSDDARERWHCDLDNICASSPALTNDGRLVVGAFDGKVYGIDADTGARLWAVDTGSLIYASPALSDTDRRAFVMSSDGVIRAFDLSGAPPQLLWEFFTGMPSFSSPAIGPDPEDPSSYLIYVGTGNGSIFALTPDGTRRWSYDTAALAPDWNNPPLDPAYWTSLRYPAINSSVALGNQGVVTATSGGLIVSVPYDAYRRETQGFTTTPGDDYYQQLSAGGVRLCYVAPSGRMAGAIVSRGRPANVLFVSPQQTLAFAALTQQTYGNGQSRSTFAQLSSDMDVSIDGTPATWRLSADGTQLYVDPPSAPGNFAITVRDAQGNVLAIAGCEVGDIPQPSSAAQVLGRAYLVEEMSIAAPFVVPALDQLGIATITIPLRFLSIQQNVAIAYAYESYSAGSADAPTRNLLYVFTGTFDNGAFRLTSSQSDFELTGAPIPIDQLTLSGVLSETPGQTRGVSLTVAYHLSLTSFATWLLTYLSHWISFGRSAATKRLGVEKIVDAVRQRAAEGESPWGPVWRFLTRLGLAGDLIAPWKLFDAKDDFFWTGTYTLSAQPAPPKAPPVSYSYDSWLKTLTVTVRFATSFGTDPPVVGILLFYDATADKLPLMLDYVELNGDPAYSADRTTITQTLSVPDEATTTSVRAKVMVNLALAQQTFVIPS